MPDAEKKDLRSVKLGRLFAEAKKRGIDGEQLRNEIAPAQLGKRLSKANAVEIEKLTQYIGGAAPRPPAPGPRTSGNFKTRYDDLGRRPGFATPAQLRGLEASWMEVSRMHTREQKERALKAFLKRIVGVDEMRFVESRHVRQIRQAIESMHAQQVRKQYGHYTEQGGKP